MRKLILNLFLGVLIILFSVSGILAATVKSIRTEMNSINKMILKKMVYTHANPSAMAAEKMEFFLDSYGRIRKAVYLNPGADGSGNITQYYSRNGRLCYVLFSENVQSSYDFRGNMYMNGRRIIKTSSKLFDNWMSRKKINKRNVPLKEYKAKRGYGNYIQYHRNVRLLKRAFKYPRGFKNKGRVRFLHKKNIFYNVNSHQVSLRSKPSLRSKILARLPAAQFVKILSIGRKKRLAVWGTFPWYRIITYIKSKPVKGWLFGAFVEPK